MARSYTFGTEDVKLFREVIRSLKPRPLCIYDEPGAFMLTKVDPDQVLRVAGDLKDCPNFHLYPSFSETEPTYLFRDGRMEITARA